MEDTATTIIPISEWNFLLGPPFLSLNESADLEAAIVDWQSVDFDDSSWSTAVVQSTKAKMLPALLPWRLYPRPIPALPELPRNFDNALKATGSIQLQQWNDFFQREIPIHIAAGESALVEFESSVLTTGFLVLKCRGGYKTKIRIMCAESYEKDLGKDKFPFPIPRSKGNRADYENGRLYGLEDFLTVGNQTETIYEPFWFRTFRYIQLEITCADAPIEIVQFNYRDTHYPLEITTQLATDLEHTKMWDISLNTLRNCMHETYEDCPFYEQNQFTMDGRVNLLFTYQISCDDRLARKTMEEFYASRRADGLLETNSPCTYRSINIPQYSLFWIIMVYDHMKYFGDKALVKRYVGVIDGILDYFDTRLNDLGLVGQFDSESWPFVDWVKEWRGTGDIRTMAIPPAYREVGAATYNSLVYAMTLNHAAEILEYIGRYDTAREYRHRAQSINDSVNKYCFADELYLDGPGVSEKSQHSQIFAILSGAVSGDAARKLLQRTLSDRSLPKCSYSLMFYTFRAAEKTGIYSEEYKSLLEPWKEMIANNLTTWAEDDVSFRSDCHLWSAVPIYETVAQVFGLSPSESGYNRLRIEPRVELQKTAQGSFATRHGKVDIRWDEEVLHVETSWDTTVDLVVNGKLEVYQLVSGRSLSVATNNGTI